MELNQAKAAKAAEVEQIRERFEKATSCVFVDFRGINVEQITELRSRFRARGVEYRVVKNTLVRKALENTELAPAELLTQLKGPTGVVWSFEEPSAGAKIIKEFRKEDEEHEKLSVKCALFDQQVMAGERVEQDLAGLPSKDEIRAMLLAQLQAPAQSLVRQLQAPGQNLSYVFDAYRRQAEGA